MKSSRFGILTGLLLATAMPGIAFAQGYPPPQQGYPPAQQGYPPAQGYPPPQQGYPPPQQGYPPGTPYGQPPAAPPPAYDMQRASLIEGQIHQLQEERSHIGFGLPITLLAVGIPTLVFGIAFLEVGTCTTTDNTDTSVYYGCTTNHSLVTTGLVLTAAGGALAALGGISLGVRIAHKGRLHREISAKQLELNQLRAPPRIGFVPTRDGGGLFTVALSF